MIALTHPNPLGLPELGKDLAQLGPSQRMHFPLLPTLTAGPGQDPAPESSGAAAAGSCGGDGGGELPGGAAGTPALSPGTCGSHIDTCPGPPRACPQLCSKIKWELSPGAGNQVKCHPRWAVSGYQTTTVISCWEAANKPTPSSAPPQLCFPRGVQAAEPRGSPRSLSSPSAQPSALLPVSQHLSLPARVRLSPLPPASLRTCSLVRVGGRGALGMGGLQPWGHALLSSTVLGVGG